MQNEKKSHIGRTNNNLRPDLIIHDLVEYEEGKHSKIFIDTVITDVYCAENINSFNDNNKIKLFSAAVIGEKQKII